MSDPMTSVRPLAESSTDGSQGPGILPSTKDSVYTPLHPWQTRLVELLPGRFESRVECNLFVADITFAEGMGIAAQSQMRPYEALSYSWGWPERTAIILCNGVQIKVPPTMAEALQYLRLGSQCRWLWCDAICINQQDDIEKSSQVQMMLTIFAKAMRVVAWLGSPDHSLDSDAELVNWMSSRGWWHRQWVVQEIFAARSLILQAGHRQKDPEFESSPVSFHKFEHCSDLLRYYGGVRFDPYFSGPSQAPKLDTPSLGPVRSTSITEEDDRASDGFCHELARAAKRHVSDPRDRVYALMGMLNNKFGNRFKDFPIDYRKTINEVFQDVTKYLVNLGIGTALLGSQYHGEAGHELPTWTLDLRQPLPQLRRIPTWALPRPYPEQQQDLARKDEFVLSGQRGAILGEPRQSFEEISLDHKSEEFLTDLRTVFRLRGIIHVCHDAVTKREGFCLVPHGSEEGDHVVYLAGRVFPEANFVLRPGAGADGQAFSLIGRGLMLEFVERSWWGKQLEFRIVNNLEMRDNFAIAGSTPRVFIIV